MNFIGTSLQKNGVDIETVTGAQTKATAAETNAKIHADLKMNSISTGSTADPNTTQESYILTNHSNSPGGGVYWHVQTYFYSSKSSNKAQIAVTYNGPSPRFMIRHVYGGSWTTWVEVESIAGAQSKANQAETNAKAAIPTKLSQLANDIGAGGGIKITTSNTEPSGNSPGDFWYKEV